MVSILNVNGTRGELHPMMHARVDSEFYQHAYASCVNTLISRYGPHQRAPGTLLMGVTNGNQGMARLIPFEFSETQVYMMEFTPQAIRFWTRNGLVTSGGAPYVVTTTYDAEDLQTLHARQSGDAVYLFSTTHRPRVLRRRGETDWEITNYSPKDGPYLPINDTPTTLQVNRTANVVPIMTSNTTFAPDDTNGVTSCTVTTSNGSVNAWYMFSRDKTINLIVGPANGFIQVELDTPAVMDNYFIISGITNAETDSMFSQWDLRGSNDGSAWVTLDSRDNEKGWAGSETRYFETNNKNAYRFYRLNYSGGSGSDPEHNTTEVGGFYMHRAIDSQQPISLTASSTEGINGGQGFRASDVGRPIRIRGTDGRWRWGNIETVVGTKQVTTRLRGHALLGFERIQDWALGAWSDVTGWPRTGRFYEDRLALAGWKDDPIGVALSVSSDYENFRTSTPLVDDDSLKLRLTGGRLDVINWLADTGSLLGGTGGGLRSIGTRDSATVLKHDNVRQRLETSVAAGALQPVQIERVHLFIDNTYMHLYEVGYSYEEDGYNAREVSVINGHLFEVGIKKIAYMSAPGRHCVCLRRDGKLVFFTYDRDQKIAGGTLVDYGNVLDINVVPGELGSELWLVVQRSVNHTTFNCVERVAPVYNKATANGRPPIYALCSYVYQGSPVSQLRNLDMLAMHEVGVYADGRDVGNATVSQQGTVVLPQGIQASTIVVGLRLPWKLVSLPVPSARIEQQGGGLMKKTRIVDVIVDMFESAGIMAGTTRSVTALRSEADMLQDPLAPTPLQTRRVKVPSEDNWANEGVFVLEGNSMYPATIRGVSVNVEMEP